MFREITPSAVYMGVLAAFTGYAASFAIVLSGLGAAGATGPQAATGLFVSTLGMGVLSILFPALGRTPAAVAWSTPGAAFLAAGAVLPGGFPEAVGALVICAALIALTGVIPALGRLIGAIPKPVANALLAGVLLKLCLAPAVGAGTNPALVLPVLGAWLLGLWLHRMAAMPLAVAAFAVVLLVTAGDGAGGGAAVGGFPPLNPLVPVFTWQSAVAVALPLYLVTMGGQNIPGFAVLELHGYPVRRSRMLFGTGAASLLIAPFGGVPVNMSAITAAMMSGEDAGRDPARRYWAAIVSGLCYVALAFAAGWIAKAAAVAPQVLITAVAGLALVPALAGSLAGALSDRMQLEAPALTFLLAGSPMVLWGIGGAVWGTLLGCVVWGLKAQAARRASPGGPA